MPIISVEIIKTIDDGKRFDKRCVVLRWSNNKVSLRQ